LFVRGSVLWWLILPSAGILAKCGTYWLPTYRNLNYSVFLSGFDFVELLMEILTCLPYLVCMLLMLVSPKRHFPRWWAFLMLIWDLLGFCITVMAVTRYPTRYLRPTGLITFKTDAIMLVGAGVISIISERICQLPDARGNRVIYFFVAMLFLVYFVGI